VFVTTGMPEEPGPQTLSGCLPAEACPEDHQIPTHAQGNILHSRKRWTQMQKERYNINYLCLKASSRQGKVKQNFQTNKTPTEKPGLKAEEMRGGSTGDQ